MLSWRSHDYTSGSALIGVFDSGVGGLGVLAEIHRLLPDADLVYLADHDFAPYGVRELDEIRTRSGQVVEWLKRQGCQVVTIACNTASAAALHPLRAQHPDLWFVGMEPAVKPAAETTERGKVGVVATAATFQGKLFASVVDRFARQVEVMTVACPRWVALVEAGLTSGESVEREVRSCLGPLLEANIDVLVLACTHYPELMEVISAVLGPEVDIIDPAPAVARQTVKVARELEMGAGGGTVRLVSTADPDRLEQAARRHGFDPDAALLPLM